MNIEDCFKIGYISKTHGLKGEITAVFENEMEVNDFTSLFLEMNGGLVPYFVETVSDRGDKCFLKLENVDSIEQASLLKGCTVYISKSLRPKLNRGQFYDDEVIGFVVEDELHGNLGQVKEVQHQGINRILSIEGHKEILVPINSPFILSVNKSKRIIKLKLPEGFLDI